MLNAWKLVTNERGAGNQAAIIAVVLLVIALIAVVFAWQRDAESVDPELDVDIGKAIPGVVTYEA